MPVLGISFFFIVLIILSCKNKNSLFQDVKKNYVDDQLKIITCYPRKTN